MLRARRDQAIGDNSSNCGEDQNTEHDANDHTSIALLFFSLELLTDDEEGTASGCDDKGIDEDSEELIKSVACLK